MLYKRTDICRYKLGDWSVDISWASYRISNRVLT